MKNLKLLVVALVAMFGFIACDKHVGNDHDHSADLVGTWTCLTENYAEALIIKADGTAVSYGVEDGKYWENVKGTVTVKENNITMIFEDDDNWTGHFDVIPGMAFSLFEENGERYIYNYCKEDLSDEVIGMWVCNDSGLPGVENHMGITTYSANGKMTMTTAKSEFIADGLVNAESDYKVVGNLMFITISAGEKPMYIARELTYSPDATTVGDIMTLKTYEETGLRTSSWLRVKQALNLTGKTYDYSSAYVTNAKGKDEDFTIMGNTFNIAKIKAYDFDKMFSANLFCVELNANSFKYKLRLDNGQYTGFDTPMTIDGNKVTLDMSAINPALRKVEMHMFQDANDTQVHFYMHTDAFINYFANMEVYTLIMEGKINQTDEAAIAKVFADMEARVESINVSFVMKARK